MKEQDRNCATSAINVLRKIYLFTLRRSGVNENLKKIASYNNINGRRTQRPFSKSRFAQKVIEQ